ncbi:MAG TPA: hypothetical protein VFJ13_01675 [Paracoccaceae bacterium]|nr:hypothetical protein [Paracoccaceae bacterium]
MPYAPVVGPPVPPEAEGFAMTAGRPGPGPVCGPVGEPAARPAAPAGGGRQGARPRRVEKPPALIMVLAPVIGLALWVALFALVF